jgi:F-type H+-transporting ATPase subunit b
MMVFVGSRKVRFLVGLVAVLAVVLTCGAVFASAGGGGGADMTKDLIWRTMNFVVLAGGLIILLKKPVAKALAGRRQGIKDHLDDLERQKQEAEQQLSEYKQKLSQLEKEVEKIVAEYVKDGEALKAKIIEEAKASAEKLQGQAKKNIEHEFAKAKKELRAEMADQAVAMAEALIKKSIKAEDQERIISEYLTKVVVAQ